MIDPSKPVPAPGDDPTQIVVALAAMLGFCQAIDSLAEEIRERAANSNLPDGRYCDLAGQLEALLEWAWQQEQQWQQTPATVAAKGD